MDKPGELFVVVDKNDKITGYHSRYECHHNKQLIHRAVGVVIFNDQGQILLQKRSMDKDTHPGFYTLSTSGHVGKSETYKQAAKRELQEELGIQSSLTRKKKYLAEREQETEMCCLFVSKHNGPFYPNIQEVDAVKFITINQLKQIRPKLSPFAIISLKQIGLL